MKTITLPDILTDVEIKRALHIFESDRPNFHKRCIDELIAPNMSRINKSLGQENDSSYLAYVVEHVLNTCAESPASPICR